MTYRSTITTEEIDTLPVGHFPGRLLVVDSAAAMREAERLLEGETLVGYDTETRPSFERGIRHGVALVQISTADTALLFRIGLQPLSAALCAMLSSPDVVKIGAAIRDDLRGMLRLARFRPAGFVDLQSLVSQWGIEELSVKKLAAIVLGIKISKAQRLTNWEAERLTAAQQDYAAMDAWVCREIYLRLRADDPARMAAIQTTLLRQQAALTAAPAKKPSSSGRRRGGRKRTASRHRQTQTRSIPHTDDTTHPADPATR